MSAATGMEECLMLMEGVREVSQRRNATAGEGEGETGKEGVRERNERHHRGKKHFKAMNGSGRRGKGIHYAGERMQTKEGKGK